MYDEKQNKYGDLNVVDIIGDHYVRFVDSSDPAVDKYFVYNSGFLGSCSVYLKNRTDVLLNYFYYDYQNSITINNCFEELMSYNVFHMAIPFFKEHIRHDGTKIETISVLVCI